MSGHDASGLDNSVVEAVRSALDEVMGMTFEEDMLDQSLADTGIDSLDLIEVVMVLEESLGISTSESDFDGVTTLRGAVEVIERRRTSVG